MISPNENLWIDDSKERKKDDDDGDSRENVMEKESCSFFSFWIQDTNLFFLLGACKLLGLNKSCSLSLLVVASGSESSTK